MTNVLISCNLRRAQISDRSVVAADIDAFAAAEYEIRCDLELGDESRLSLVIDVNTATALGAALIGQAALSRQASDADIDHHRSRYSVPTAEPDHRDEIPF